MGVTFFTAVRSFNGKRTIIILICIEIIISRVENTKIGNGYSSRNLNRAKLGEAKKPDDFQKYIK
jgi:hypothetical protein